MKARISELVGTSLDWAVSEALGLTLDYTGGFLYSGREEYDYIQGLSYNEIYSPSTNWQQGGPIIEREEIHTYTQFPRSPMSAKVWYARLHDKYRGFGPTLLIAAMRCYVSSRLGDIVEIPDELT